MPSSVILYNTQWHNSLGSLLSSPASSRMSPHQSLSSKNNDGSDSVMPNGSHDTTSQSSQKLLLKHKRHTSRPFDVLYQGTPTKSMQLDKDFENYKTASYIEIEEAIRCGKSTAMCVSSPISPPPAVTHVKGSSPRRSRSLISNSPTLRRRNTFKSRNKMQKRQASPQRGNSSSSVFSGQSKAKKNRNRASKLSFVFPIKRRTSYKYFPVSRALPKESKFTSQKDIDDYFVNDNIFALMKDVLPRTMDVFKYKNLTNINPELTSEPHRFAISRDAKFTLLERDPSIAAVDKAPLQGEKVAESESSAANGTNQRDTASSENSLLAKRRTFLNAVHVKYRAVVFSEGGKLPQKVEDAFPFEGDMMSDEEKEKINTQILLEILLRRTVAAKIDFRLRRSGVSAPRKRQNRPRSSMGHSSNTSGSSSSFETSNRKQRHTEGKRHSRHQVDLSNGDTTSINTDELMQQNASLLSELLPSPQISFTSNILAMDVFPAYSDDADSRSVGNDSKRNSESRMSDFRLDQSKLQDWKMRNLGSSYDRWNDMYIPDSSKVDLAQKKRLRPVSSPLGNVNDTSLRPLKSSNHTMSTHSFHSMENLALYDSMSTSSAYAPQKRVSNSTGETTRYTESSSLHNKSDYAQAQSIPNDLSQMLQS